MVTQEPTKRCSYCAERILAAAIKCRYCGEMLSPALPTTNYSAMTYGWHAPSQEHDIWRRGNTLVMHKSALLPDRCVKCNAPAYGSRLKRKLTWQHRAWILPLFAGLFLYEALLLYIIVILIISRSAKVSFGLCETHIKRRRIEIIVGWGLFLLGFSAISIGISQENLTYGFTGAFFIIVSIVFAFKAQIVTVYKMDKQYIWLKRVNKDYLTQLPEMPKSVEC